MPNIITLAQLKEARACSAQTRTFRSHFGTEAKVTLKAALAVSSLFNWSWAGRHLLTRAASKAYEDAMIPASKAYEKARATAFVQAYCSKTNAP